jgi:site-specific DNA-methyltransferase (adenine-specific)
VNVIHYQDDTVAIHHGDCLDVLQALPDNSVHAVVTDPPYGISFMGREWDQPGKYGSRRSKGAGEDMSRNGHYDHTQTRERGGAMAAGEYDRSIHAMQQFQAWCTEWATECLRVLKPGGHILAFGGTRTWHRLAAAIEDAGFEIRDSIAWLYGSGFPKSLDVSKAIDKAAGAQREVVGQVDVGPDMRGDNYGRGDGARMIADITAPATEAAQRWSGWGTALKPAFEPIVVGRKPFRGAVAANVIAHGTGALNIDGCRIGTEVLPEQRAGQAKLGTFERSDMVTPERTGRWPSNVALDDTQAAELDKQSGYQRTGATGPGANGFRSEYVGGAKQREGFAQPKFEDGGGASRFFPTFRYNAKAPTSERPTVDGQGHATVKPLELMRWLVRLVTPPDGTVLEPFAGSGTTVEACLREGKPCIAIERDDTYLQLIVNRIDQTQLGFDIGA